MRILLLGRQGQDHRAATDVLQQAGHTTVECYRNQADWACVALDGLCPLDTYTEVAVAPRLAGGATHDGAGAVCSRRRRVPIVAIGADAGQPIRSVAEAVVSGCDAELVAACERIAAGPSPAHTRAARRALADVVHPGDHVDVSVTRGPGGLHAWVTTSETDRSQRAALVERVRAGLARFDPQARGIAISLRSPTPS
jgi:hypothetical protein